MQVSSNIEPRNSNRTRPGLAHRITTYLPDKDLLGVRPPPWPDEPHKQLYMKDYASSRIKIPLFYYQEEISPEVLKLHPEAQEYPYVDWFCHSIREVKGFDPADFLDQMHLMCSHVDNWDPDRLHEAVIDCPYEVKMKKHGTKEWMPTLFQLDLRAGDIKRLSGRWPSLLNRITRRRVPSILDLAGNEYRVIWHLLG
jgi:hypothetical protein